MRSLWKQTVNELREVAREARNLFRKAKGLFDSLEAA